jgi:hypothetical protein
MVVVVAESLRIVLEVDWERNFKDENLVKGKQVRKLGVVMYNLHLHYMLRACGTEAVLASLVISSPFRLAKRGHFQTTNRQRNFRQGLCSFVGIICTDPLL